VEADVATAVQPSRLRRSVYTVGCVGAVYCVEAVCLGQCRLFESGVE